MTDLKDSLLVGGVELGCRLFTGTGKYGDDALIPGIVAASGCEVVTVALRRVDLGNPGDNILSHIPAGVRLLPNTSGARSAEEAARIIQDRLSTYVAEQSGIRSKARRRALKTPAAGVKMP